MSLNTDILQSASFFSRPYSANCKIRVVVRIVKSKIEWLTTLQLIYISDNQNTRKNSFVHVLADFSNGSALCDHNTEIYPWAPFLPEKKNR